MGRVVARHPLMHSGILKKLRSVSRDVVVSMMPLNRTFPSCLLSVSKRVSFLHDKTLHEDML